MKLHHLLLLSLCGLGEAFVACSSGCGGMAVRSGMQVCTPHIENSFLVNLSMTHGRGARNIPPLHAKRYLVHQHALVDVRDDALRRRASIWFHADQSCALCVPNRTGFRKREKAQFCAEDTRTVHAALGVGRWPDVGAAASWLGSAIALPYAFRVPFACL